MYAWLITLAASILLLIQFFSSQNFTNKGTTSTVTERTNLLNQANDLLKLDWQAGLHPFETQVEGDVVWSNSKQKGYMRFRDMPVNDPTIEQYQLWIIDPTRDEKPIDGGVFNIAQKGEVIIPIDAKLKVNSPQVFAITIEKPGGVVVSKQENLPLLAKID